MRTNPETQTRTQGQLRKTPAVVLSKRRTRIQYLVVTVRRRFSGELISKRSSSSSRSERYAYHGQQSGDLASDRDAWSTKRRRGENRASQANEKVVSKCQTKKFESAATLISMAKAILMSSRASISRSLRAKASIIPKRALLNDGRTRRIQGRRGTLSKAVERRGL